MSGAALPLRGRISLAYALTALVSLLLPVAAVAGLIYGDRGLYDSYPADLAGLVGQDVIALAVVLPLLVFSTRLAARGSVFALPLWTGSLFWVAYYYFFYVVGGFNALFLVYLGLVSAGLYGLLSLLFAVDADVFAKRFDRGVPAQLIGGFCMGVAVLFALMWGSMVLASLAAGTRPDEVTREVAIVDLTVMLPLLFYGGLRLWRREPWGYVLGGLLLVKQVLSGFTLAFTTALGAWWAGAVDPFQAFLFVLFTTMTVGAGYLFFLYTRGILAQKGRRADLR